MRLDSHPMQRMIENDCRIRDTADVGYSLEQMAWSLVESGDYRVTSRLEPPHPGSRPRPVPSAHAGQRRYASKGSTRAHAVIAPLQRTDGQRTVFDLANSSQKIDRMSWECGYAQPPPESPLLWTRGVAARATLNYLDRRGIDAKPALFGAGISRRQLSQDDVGLSVASQYRFLELAAAEASDQLLGLHVAAEMDIRAIGILFYLTGSAPTVSEALENLARYSRTTNECKRRSKNPSLKRPDSPVAPE